MTTPAPDGQSDPEADPEAGTVTWRELQAETVDRLRRAGRGDPGSEARWLVEEASGFEGADYVLGLDQPATVRGVARLDRLVERRRTGEPIQYVLGRWPFRSLDLFVDERVLIPRPETEQVVGVALTELAILATGHPDRPPRVVDLGTGSGAIALSIAVEHPGAEVWATDRSPDALAVAGANLAGHGRAAARVRLAGGSWFEALAPELRGSIDLVISNPPYVAAAEPLPAEVADWEPAGALIPGPSGTEALVHLIERAPEWLARPGVLVLELAPGQAPAMADAARAEGFTAVRVAPDLAGRDRALVARIG